MSVASHHAEWLSLVETSGPFLSMPVLLRAFPNGLDPYPTERVARLREAYEDWLDRAPRKFALHREWVKQVFTELLEYPPEFLVEGQAIPPGLEAAEPQFGETLRPDWVLKQRDLGGRAQLLISLYPASQKLDSPVPDKVWKASPGTRMMELLHASDVSLGLVTNGEHWMLVYAPRGETTGFASWYTDLWMQEPITVRAFYSLLHLRRFFGVAPEDTLPVLYAASAKDQQEVTDQLGYQVRQAVEILVQEFDRIDGESGRDLLAGISEKEIYDSALTVMMRLVFLFAAEERRLLLLGDAIYDRHYAVSTLSALLRETADQYGEELLERRHDAWCRLLASFRAVYAGVQHEAMRLPPYGGTLFDPDRYPFLEGRAKGTNFRSTAAQPLPINNRVVLHLLEALQILRVKIPGGGPAEARRLSFRALDVEQIGHVYEGLLDHTAKRATEVVLGLAGARDREPEIPLSKLEDERAKGIDPLVEFVAEETGRQPTTVRRALEPKTVESILLLDRKHAGKERTKRIGTSAGIAPFVDDHKLLIACGQDPGLFEKVEPFAALLRENSFGQLVVIHEGSVYVTHGSDRRSTGTHYTPRSLTEPIVKHTLEPLVYIGPAEGKPKEQWQLKSAKEIVDLKICDMTMGSGAFLVQACRYLAERLVEAWEIAEKTYPGKILATPEGDFSEGDPRERLIPIDSTERLAIARRYIADRCLYGVDINPMAVEMAKLSLWLITLQKDRPFTFLDHALKCGDSLVGVSSLEQIETFSLRPGQQRMTFVTSDLFRCIEDASAKRRALEALPSNDYTQIETKNLLHVEAEIATSKAKALADALIAFELRGLDGDAYKEQRTHDAERLQLLMKRDADAGIETSNPKSELGRAAREQLRGRRTFHWPVEFPEVFARGGFNAFVGNPPYMGGQKISGNLGPDYRAYLLQHIAAGQRGSADLCAYVLRRIVALLGLGGGCGMVVTSAVTEGDSREVGLDCIVSRGVSIMRAGTRIDWQGTASVTVATLWLWNGGWAGTVLLNDSPVGGIATSLVPAEGNAGKPKQLQENAGLSFQGSIVLGKGFILSEQEAKGLVKKNPRNADVIQRYLIGEEINAAPDHKGDNWVINFRDWPLSRESAQDGYSGPVASDFPDCLRIVEERVKPERLKNKIKSRREQWWQYAARASSLYEAIRPLCWCLAIATQATKYVAFAPIAERFVFSHALAVIATDSFAIFGTLSSSLHEVWAREHGSYNLQLLRYAPSDLVQTFPFPRPSAKLQQIGKEYLEFRSQIMQSRQEGPTKTYNRFHDGGERSEDIVRLRALHVEMDQVVAAAYSWSDLDLGHGFHETKQGERYTISESARRIVLDRLLALNHQRYDEEIKAGLHEKKAKSTAGRGRKSKADETRIVAEQHEMFNEK